MKAQVRHGVAVIGIILVIAGCAANEQAGEAGSKDVVSIDGLSLPFEIKKYAELSDLVVRGTPVSDRVRPFTSNPGIPAGVKDDEMYQSAGYHDVTFEVAEYIKGKGPKTLSIRRLEPPEDVRLSSEEPVPVIGQDQILFLGKGTGLWSGGYLILGQQSVGDVSGHSVTFEESGKRFSLDDFRGVIREISK